MHFDVTKKKLIKIIGNSIKLEDGSDFQFSKKELNAIIDKGMIDILDKDNIKTKIYKKYIDLINNKKNQNDIINIDLGNEKGVPEKIFKDWKSVAQWFAVNNSEEQRVVCNIEGSDAVINAIFDKDLIKIENIKTHPINFNAKEINWNLDFTSVDNNWGNTEFVMQRLAGKEKEEILNLIKLISNDLWEDKDFINTYMSSTIHFESYGDEFIPKKVLMSDLFFDYMLNNNKFYEYFEKYYKITFNDFVYESLLMNEYDVMDIDKILSLDEDSDESIICKKLVIKFFNNKEILSNLLENGENKKIKNFDIDSINDFFKYFTTHIREDITILNKIESISANKKEMVFSGLNIFKYIPESFFKEKTTKEVVDFIKSHPSIAFNSHTSYSGEVNERIKLLLKDKSIALDLISHFTIEFNKSNNQKDARTITDIKKALEKDIIYSKDFLIELIKIKDITINSNDFNHYKKYCKNKDVIREIVDNKFLPLISWLEPKVLYELTDKDLIKKAVANDSNLLLDKNVPKEWLLDLDIVLSINSSFFYEKFNRTFWNELVTTEEIAKKLINKSQYTYEFLPKEFKVNPNIGLELFNSYNSYFSSNLLKVDSSLWFNQKFCLDVCEINSAEANKMIPKLFWNDSDFIIDLFQRIDDKKIPANVLLNAPKVIIKTLDDNSVQIGEYSKFFKICMNKQQLEKNMAEKNELSTNIKRMKI